MNRSPAISVLLLSHNHVRYVGQAVESVLGQTWGDWELVVVDNRSDDGSWELLHEYEPQTHRLRLLRPERKVGIAAALNLGLGAAGGKYIARIDSDDTWREDKLARQMEFMGSSENWDVGVCGTNCLLIDAGGRTLARKEFPQAHAECLRAFWYRNPVCHTAALIRKECFDRFGGYDEAFELAEDLELWFRFGQRFHLANLAGYLTQVRISGANVTLERQHQVIRSTVAARLRAIRRYGYRPSAAGRLALAATVAMQLLPPKLVHRLFNCYFLPRCSFLWREAPRLAKANPLPEVSSAAAPALHANRS